MPLATAAAAENCNFLRNFEGRLERRRRGMIRVQWVVPGNERIPCIMRTESQDLWHYFRQECGRITPKAETFLLPDPVTRLRPDPDPVP